MRGFADWRAQVAPQVKLCTERISQMRRAQLFEVLSPGLNFASRTLSGGRSGDWSGGRSGDRSGDGSRSGESDLVQYALTNLLAEL